MDNLTVKCPSCEQETDPGNMVVYLASDDDPTGRGWTNNPDY